MNTKQVYSWLLPYTPSGVFSVAFQVVIYLIGIKSDTNAGFYLQSKTLIDEADFHSGTNSSPGFG